jgi:LPXTG-site transpeptidase (sortase) family protein
MADRPWGLRGLAVLAAVGVLAGALLPQSVSPLPLGGYTLHLIAFAVLGALWHIAGLLPRRLSARVSMGIGAAVAVELLQALLTTERHASPLDALASFAGGVLGAGGMAWFSVGRGWVRGLALLALVPALMQGFGATQTALRPALVDFLLEQAWSRAMRDRSPRQPWPGAPARVAFALSFAGRPGSVLVVDTARPAALALAPGVSEQGAQLGQAGLMLVEGHRNAAFSVLDELRPGQMMYAVSAGGAVFAYEVTSRELVRWNDTGLLDDVRGQELALATCWPVKGRVPTPLRLLVRARRV